MKVCDLALFSPETSSGVKTYIHSKIEYVRHRPDVEHVVIVAGREPRVSREGRSKVVVVRGVPSLYPGVRFALNVWNVAGIIEREDPDIIELNCQYAMPWAAFLATRRSRTPVVGVYHTDVPACARHLTRGAGERIAAAVERFMEWYEGVIYRHCTVTILLNPRFQDRVRRLGVERTCCLPCGVDVTMFSPARRDPSWRARLGIRPAATTLLYAGRLSAEKELDVLLAAYTRLPQNDFQLVIAGDGPRQPAVARFAETHPGVFFVGHLESRAELATAYASCDIFVIPGRYETFGMATLEAVASGLPVVGIHESGTAALVPDGFGILARAGDAEGLAAAMATVATWPLDDRRAVHHAFAAERYSWDSVLDQYFEVYRRVLDEAARAAA